ncbi:MAG TPA: hypothetical protein VKE50_12245 [Thermoanaerobaculia bacterium]|nr:hypothetical protein [Thermoanaerobaculia bacterium]
MSEGIMLGDVLGLDAERLPVRLAAGIEQTPDLAAVKTLLTLKFSGPQWVSLTRTIVGKMQEALEVPLTTILARAWNDLLDVRKALNATRESPGRTEVVALADHTIESEHKPYLDLYENGKQIGRLPFSAKLEIELRGLLLEIAGGAIRKMRTGEIQTRGTLKVGDFTLAEKALSPVRIPGEFPLEKPEVDR